MANKDNIGVKYPELGLSIEDDSIIDGLIDNNYKVTSFGYGGASDLLRNEEVPTSTFVDIEDPDAPKTPGILKGLEQLLHYSSSSLRYGGQDKKQEVIQNHINEYGDVFNTNAAKSTAQVFETIFGQNWKIPYGHLVHKVGDKTAGIIGKGLDLSFQSMLVGASPYRFADNDSGNDYLSLVAKKSEFLQDYREKHGDVFEQGLKHLWDVAGVSSEGKTNLGALMYGAFKVGGAVSTMKFDINAVKSYTGYVLDSSMHNLQFRVGKYLHSKGYGNKASGPMGNIVSINVNELPKWLQPLYTRPYNWMANESKSKDAYSRMINRMFPTSDIKLMRSQPYKGKKVNMVVGDETQGILKRLPSGVDDATVAAVKKELGVRAKLKGRDDWRIEFDTKTGQLKEKKYKDLTPSVDEFKKVLLNDADLYSHYVKNVEQITSNTSINIAFPAKKYDYTMANWRFPYKDSKRFDRVGGYADYGKNEIFVKPMPSPSVMVHEADHIINMADHTAGIALNAKTLFSRQPIHQKFLNRISDRMTNFRKSGIASYQGRRLDAKIASYYDMPHIRREISNAWDLDSFKTLLRININKLPYKKLRDKTGRRDIDGDMYEEYLSSWWETIARRTQMQYGENNPFIGKGKKQRYAQEQLEYMYRPSFREELMKKYGAAPVAMGGESIINNLIDE